MHERYPGIVVHSDIDQRFSKLGPGEAQIGLRTNRGQEKGTVGRKVCRLATSVYASRGYLATHPAPRRYEDLAKHNFITMDDTLFDIPSMEWLSRYISESNIVYRVNNMYAQRAAMRVGLGLAILGCSDCDEDPELVRLFPPIEDMKFELWLVTHKDLRRNARVRSRWQCRYGSRWLWNRWCTSL